LASGCAACAGAAGLLASPSWLAAADRGQQRPRIRIIYSIWGVKQPKPTWPHVGFDFQPVIERIEVELKRQCPGLEFVSAMADGPEAAQKILDADKAADVDGYLVYQMNNWPRVVESFAASRKPTLFADFTYGGSGGFLQHTARLLRKRAANFGFVSSSRIEDVAAAVRCFEPAARKGAADFATAVAAARKEATPAQRAANCTPDPVATISPADCLRRMNQSRVLAVRGKPQEPTRDGTGIEVVGLPFTAVGDAWKMADPDVAQQMADRWQKTAVAITDVSRKTLEESAAMYLARKTLLAEHKATVSLWLSAARGSGAY
jgi:hypothetical protein